MTPLVSINCITYNHAPFIRDALDGFVMQKTNFPFEVVLHDDASDDGTQDIIREYERNYPKLFNVIYQKENQYSKGVKISPTFQSPRIRGKYVAACEGDDYWIDPNKLQRQVNYMEAHEDCACSFHPTFFTDESEGGRVTNPVQWWFHEEDLREEFVIPFGNYAIVTCSMVCRTNWQNTSPKFRLMASVGDYPSVCELVSHGNFHYFPQVMGVYRWKRAGSWSEKFDSDRDFAVKYLLNSLEWLYEYYLYRGKNFAELIGKKMERFVEGLTARNAYFEHPWLGMLEVKSKEKRQKLDDLKKISAETDDGNVKAQLKSAELEYYTWYLEKIGEKVK